MSYQVLKLERTGHVATITFNRPEVMNALDRHLTQEIHQVLDEVAEEFPAIRVVLITGEGRGFCSGADLAQMRDSILKGDAFRTPAPTDEAGRRLRIQEIAPHLRQIPQPTIAAVNGAATGAGLSIALACDVRIASEAARFSAIFIKRSLVADTASSHTMASLAGHAVAAEMALTGNIYDAQWALNAGLVSRVVPAENLMDTACELADEIAANPPLAVKATKQLLYAHEPDWHDVIRREDEAGASLSGSKDQKEAVLAFVEKRQPVFTGE